MTHNPIHFGISGWRGFSVDNFTFARIRLAAAGIAHQLLNRAALTAFLDGRGQAYSA